MPNDSATFRERAGVLVSALIVIALLAIGFIQLLLQILAGQGIRFDQTWMVQVSGLAGIALGYLIGKQSTQTSAGPPAVTPSEPTSK